MIITMTNRKTETRRVTILIDMSLDRKIRQIQARYIDKNFKSISYSAIVNQVINSGITYNGKR